MLSVDSGIPPLTRFVVLCVWRRREQCALVFAFSSVGRRMRGISRETVLNKRRNRMNFLPFISCEKRFSIAYLPSLRLVHFASCHLPKHAFTVPRYDMPLRSSAAAAVAHLSGFCDLFLFHQLSNFECFCISGIVSGRHTFWDKRRKINRRLPSKHHSVHSRNETNWSSKDDELVGRMIRWGNGHKRQSIGSYKDFTILTNSVQLSDQNPVRAQRFKCSRAGLWWILGRQWTDTSWGRARINSVVFLAVEGYSVYLTRIWDTAKLQCGTGNRKKPRFNWNLHVLFIFSSSPCRNSLKTDGGKKARKKHMWNVCSEIIDKENCVWNGEKTPKTQQNINATCRNKNHTRFVVCYCRAFLAMGYQNTTNIARRNKRFVANDFSCCSCANKSDRKRNNKNCLASAIPVFRFYFILFYLTYLTFHVCPIQGSSVMMFSQ